MALYQPINYGALQPVPDFAEAISSGLAIGANFKQARAQQQAREIALENARIAQQRQQQKQEAYRAVLSDPRAGAAEYSKLSALFPEDSENLKRSFDMQDKAAKDSDLKQMSAVYGYLRGGQKDLAKQALQARIDADVKAGVDASTDQRLLASIDADEVQAANTVGIILSSLTGDKFGETIKAVGGEARADEAQPDILRKGAAEASKAETEAAFAPTVTATGIANTQSQIEERNRRIALDTDRLSLDWEKLNLDKDALKTNTALKVEELLQSGAKVEGASLTELTNSVGSAQKNAALSERTGSLADRLAASDARGGFLAGTGEWIKQATGNVDAVSSLRQEYQRLVNSSVIQNLPPGAASDRDIAVAREGFPSPTAPKEYVVSFLRGLSKLQDIAAQGDQAKADWISVNNNLGTAKRDLDVGGVRVPKGTTFGEFMKNRSQMRARNTPPASVDAIIQKYRGYKGSR